MICICFVVCLSLAHACPFWLYIGGVLWQHAPHAAVSVDFLALIHFGRVGGGGAAVQRGFFTCISDP